MLLHEMFAYCYDVGTFVNQNNIQKGDIQTIFYSPKDGKYHLFYWR